MTHTATADRSALLPGGPPAGPTRARLVVAAATSFGLALLGLWNALTGYWLFADPESTLLRSLLTAELTGQVLIALGAVGVVAAMVVVLYPRAPIATPLLSTVAAVEVLGLGVAFQSVSTIALAGYLVAMVLPFGLVWMGVQAVRRYRRLRWVVLAAAIAVALWGAVTGALRPDTLRSLAVNLGGGFARHSDALVMVLLLGVATTCWVLVSVRLVRRSPAYGMLGRWVQRHRRALTIIAAAGPLPYALIRSTWLTPWPLMTAGETLAPEMRLWGLLLGGGATLGAVLTVGLIRPWGEAFPRWMPWLGGRAVPVAAAIVPGGLIAGVLCASAIPMLQLTLSPVAETVFDGLPLIARLGATLVFPFWLWGPALALAVWGYALARGDQTVPQAR